MTERLRPALAEEGSAVRTSVIFYNSLNYTLLEMKMQPFSVVGTAHLLLRTQH